MAFLFSQLFDGVARDAELSFPSFRRKRVAAVQVDASQRISEGECVVVVQDEPLMQFCRNGTDECFQFLPCGLWFAQMDEVYISSAEQLNNAFTAETSTAM